MEAGQSPNWGCSAKEIIIIIIIIITQYYSRINVKKLK
jgi:hypothetical protein